MKRDIPYLAGASTLKGMRLTNIAKISFVQNQMEENVFTLLKVIFVLQKSFSGLLVQANPKQQLGLRIATDVSKASNPENIQIN